MLTSLTKQLRGLFAFLNHMWNLRILEMEEIFVPKILPHKGYQFEYSSVTRKWEQLALLPQGGPRKTGIAVANSAARNPVSKRPLLNRIAKTSTESSNDNLFIIKVSLNKLWMRNPLLVDGRTYCFHSQPKKIFHRFH